MRWKFRDQREWHPHFLWLPVIIAGEWVWLERVLRRDVTPPFSCPLKFFRYKNLEGK